jgi:hypothetical protein
VSTSTREVRYSSVGQREETIRVLTFDSIDNSVFASVFAVSRLTLRHICDPVSSLVFAQGNEELGCRRWTGTGVSH